MGADLIQWAVDEVGDEWYLTRFRTLARANMQPAKLKEKLEAEVSYVKRQQEMNRTVWGAARRKNPQLPEEPTQDFLRLKPERAQAEVDRLLGKGELDDREKGVTVPEEADAPDPEPEVHPMLRGEEDGDGRPKVPHVTCSSLDSVMACPGGHRARLGVTDPGNAATEAGNRIHAALEGREEVELNPEEAGKVASMKRRVETLLETFGQYDESLVERRLWWRNKSGTPVLSGKADRIYIQGDRALVIDFKSHEVPMPADLSWQLRGLAVLVAMYRRMESVEVAFVTPFEMATAQFVREDLLTYLDDLKGVLREAYGDGAERVPGVVQCRYCQAAGTARCPESIAVVERAEKELAGVDLATMTAEDLGAYLKKTTLARKLIGKMDEAAVKEARERLMHGQEVPGWTLTNPRVRRNVVSASEAYAKLSVEWHGEEEFAVAFAECCNVGISSLDQVWRRGQKLKVTDAKADLERILGETLEKKASLPSLKEDL